MSTYEDIGVRLDNVEFKALTKVDNQLLTEPFKVKEVKDIWSRESSKSPEPDGVSFKFVKKH